jgi:glycosyltransferase involved in cell wall biosynthesis
LILTVGRLSKEKGQADLIESAHLLQIKNTRSKHKLRFVLAGEGPDLSILMRLVKERGLESEFVFVGHVPDLAPYYSLADLVVLPSHSEGSPNVLLEAMAAGCPIVATAVGGVPDIVANGQEAIIVEKENATALADAIARVLLDSSLKTRLAEAARQKAKLYSPAGYCDSMLSLYADCLGQQNDGRQT